MLIDLAFGTEGQQAELTLRLQGWLQMATPEMLTEAQDRVTALVTRRVETLWTSSFGELTQWQASLRAITNQLETIEVAAKHAVAREAGIQVAELGAPDPPGLLMAEDDSPAYDTPPDGSDETTADGTADRSDETTPVGTTSKQRAARGTSTKETALRGRTPREDKGGQ